MLRSKQDIRVAMKKCIARFLGVLLAVAVTVVITFSFLQSPVQPFLQQPSLHRNSHLSPTTRRSHENDSQSDPSSSHLRFVSRLTRVADQLSFNHSACPQDSLAQTNPQIFSTSNHSDCPSLYVIGARKGGTTSLIQYLSKHPNFKGPRLDDKEQAGELFYFSHKFGYMTWQNYMSYFPHVPGVLYGESSVNYATICDVPQRIVSQCGADAKVVYLLRNPFRRFESNYLMRTRLNPKYANADFGKIFMSELKLFPDSLITQINKATTSAEILKLAHAIRCLKRRGGAANMLYDSLYLVFLSNWLCNYLPNNIMIVNSEEFFQEPGSIISKVWEFIGLSALNDSEVAKITSTAYNKPGPSYQPASVSLNTVNKKKLISLFEPFTRELLEFLQWEVDWSY